MKPFKLHYNKTHVNGERLCHQDRLHGGCTTVVANVTCKKCKRILLNKIGVHGKTANSIMIIESVAPMGSAMAGTLKLANESLGKYHA